jgi:hypothetical protein
MLGELHPSAGVGWHDGSGVGLTACTRNKGPNDARTTSASVR